MSNEPFAWMGFFIMIGLINFGGCYKPQIKIELDSHLTTFEEKK